MGTPNIDTNNTETEAQPDFEQRFKDTQKAYTQSRQEIAEIRQQLVEAQAELEAREKAQKVTLTPEEQLELEALRETDIDAYFAKRTEFENKTNQFKQEFKTKALEDIEKQAITKSNETVYEEFKKLNPGFNIDQPDFLKQIPPIYVEQVRAGTISLEEFLNTSKEFILANKQFKNTIPETPYNVEPTSQSKPSTLSHTEYANLNF